MMIVVQGTNWLTMCRHRNGGVRGLERLQLCRKRSMMRMTPPQSGQAGTLADVRASESTGDARHRLALSARD